MSVQQLVITIKAGTATAREVDTARGKRTFKEQVGFIEANDEVRKIRVPLDHDQAPYPAGRYTLAPSSFTVSKYHDLEINRFEFSLIPLSAQQPVAKVG